jgi:hypothetical protein
VRLLAEAPCEQVIDMLGDVTPPAVADPDERGELAYLLTWPLIRADEGAEQLQGTLGLFLAEPADEQLQPLPSCHTVSVTAGATTCRASHSHQAFRRRPEVAVAMSVLWRRFTRVPP